VKGSAEPLTVTRLQVPTALENSGPEESPHARIETALSARTNRRI